MYPILYGFGPLSLHTYGLLIALGVFLGLRIAILLAKKDGYASEEVAESLHHLIFYLVIFGMIGGRILHAAIYWDQYADDLFGILKVWEGGLVSYGGLIGTFFGFYLWHRKNKFAPWRKVTDWLAPSLAFGHVLGRLGCFFAGCCYGLPTEKPWGVIFTDAYSLAPLGVALHPTQIYEALFLVLLGFFLLWRFYRRKVDGAVFAEYLIFYPLGRFFIEFYRGGEPKITAFTPGQLSGILIFSMALVFRFYLSRRERQ